MYLSGFDIAHHDPELLVEGSGVQSEFRLDSRYKHAGMTDPDMDEPRAGAS
jgi:hypothetical protein